MPSLLPFLLLFFPLVDSAPTLPPRKTKYNETLAETLLHLSAGAYGLKKDECVKNTFPESDDRFLYTSISQSCDIVDSTCESFVVTSNNVSETIIVFRGTKKRKQLFLESWASFQIGTGFNGMGKVNRYFITALSSLWSPIMEFLRDPKYADHNLIFTGHSLGGALATLAAAQTVKIGLRPANKVRVYTFGQPRTGSYEFAKNYDALGIESYRVIHSSDLVPHQPSCKPDKSVPKNIDGVRPCLAGVDDKPYHQGTEIWYPQNMTAGSLFIECTGEPKNEDASCSNMLPYTMENKERYFWDHRHYFDVSLANFGKSGCTNRTKKADPKKSKFSKVVNAISDILSG